MSSRGKRGRHGAAAAATSFEVNSGEGGGGLGDKENGGGEGDDDDEDLEKLAGSVAGCSVSSKGKKARVTESVSQQVDRSLMERFRTMAANEFADAEAGSEAERLWDAALRAARTVSEAHASFRGGGTCSGSF